MATFKKVLLQSSGGDNLFPKLTSSQVLYDTSGKTLETAYNNAISSLLDKIYPIGALYCSTKPTHPHTLFPGTYWKKVDGGNIIVGAGSYTDSNSVTCNFIAGQKNVEYWSNVSLTRDEMPNHTHLLYQRATSSGRDGWDEWGDGTSTTTLIQGSGAGHNNIMASTVVYMWERVATAEEESDHIITSYLPAIPDMKAASYLGYTVTCSTTSASNVGQPYYAFSRDAGVNSANSYKIVNDDANGYVQNTTLTITFPKAIIPKYIRIRAQSTNASNTSVVIPSYTSGSLGTSSCAFNENAINRWMDLRNENNQSTTSLSFKFTTYVKGTQVTVESIEITETSL